MKLLWELILKDLRLFAADRKAMIISFAVPIAIASFMAMLMGGGGPKTKPTTKVPVLVVDEDRSEVSGQILAKLKESPSLAPKLASRQEAQSQVDKGQVPLAVILPKGFGVTASAALQGGAQAELQTITDPAKNTEAQIGKGYLTQAVMQVVTKASFSGMGANEAAFRAPYIERELAKPATDGGDKERGPMAHAFVGMAVQGLLFWAIDAAMGLMRERREGIWRRLRAAPVPPLTLLLARVLSSALRAVSILIVVFGFGALVFHFRISGSVIGFILVAAAAALMTATFGLFIAALGKTEQQSRGLSILAVLAMTMLGGAWFPSFLMPAWVQTVSLIIPVRWAVDGFDAMTWRAQDLATALPSVAALLGFAAVFAGIAYRRMSWEIDV